MNEYAQVQALVARLYGLDEEDLAHVLATFPLIPDEIKEGILREFHAFTDTGHRDTETPRL